MAVLLKTYNSTFKKICRNYAVLKFESMVALKMADRKFCNDLLRRIEFQLILMADFFNTARDLG